MTEEGVWRVVFSFTTATNASRHIAALGMSVRLCSPILFAEERLMPCAEGKRLGTTEVRESEAFLYCRKSQTDESRLVYNGCIAELQRWGH